MKAQARLPRTTCRRVEFCAEVTAKLCRIGEKIEEVPITTHAPHWKERKSATQIAGWRSVIALCPANAGCERIWKSHKRHLR